MLKTCSRCRARRIKCDARLPSCLGCQRSSSQCSYYDEVLQEEIPRSYIKNLYDRIDELQALISVYQSRSPSDNERSDESKTGLPSADQFHYIVPSRTRQNLLLGPSPPVILGNITIAKLQQLGHHIKTCSIITGIPGTDSLPVTASRCERNTISPSMIHLLLSHYSSCIEPAYPIMLHTGDEVDCNPKQLDDNDRCRVLLACAIAATHKSYHYPSWKAVAKTCREWAGDLVKPFIDRRDNQTVVLLLALIVYELADPEAGLMWELLVAATQICLELGWHRIGQDASEENLSNKTSHQEAPYDGFGTEDKSRLLSVLAGIERPLSIISQRPPMLGDDATPSDIQKRQVYDAYQRLILALFSPGSGQRPGDCPASETYSDILGMLQALPDSNPATHECWLLLHPALAHHNPCDHCSSYLFDNDTSATERLKGLHSRIVQEAASLVDTVHPLVISQDVFIPPILAASRAFMAACVLTIGVASHWSGSENSLGPLLKCSEVLMFTSSLWEGGRDYFDIYRQIAKAIP